MTASNQAEIAAREPARSQGPRATSIVIALAPVAAVVILGAALRISQIHQSLFGDELWSYVGATHSSIGQVIDYIGTDQEITPPLYTLLAWLSAKAGDPTALIRLPSLLGGIVTIPLTYALGLRTLGSRCAALLAAMLAALSPFLIWYSVEARAYGLAIALVLASTLSLLLAIDRGRWRWWVAYAGFSCAAMYAHYTAVFVLVAQLAWALWFHPEVRKRAVVVNLAAAIAYLPWLPGLVDDFQSPTRPIYSALVPFNLDNFTEITARFVVGPWGSTVSSTAEAALICGFALATAGAVLSWRAAAQRESQPSSRFEGLSLIAMLALAAPVGAAVSSLIGDDIYLARNLGTSWPGLAVAMAALLTAGPLILRTVATILVAAPFVAGAIRTTGPDLQRPGFREAAAFIDERAGPHDLVLDINPSFLHRTNKTQPPALALDVNLEEPHNTIDYLNPADGRRALKAAAGRRLVLAGNGLIVGPVREALGLSDVRPVAERSYQGIIPVRAEVFAIPHLGDRTRGTQSHKDRDG